MATARTTIRTGIVILLVAIAIDARIARTNPPMPARISAGHTVDRVIAAAAEAKQTVHPAYPEDLEIFEWATGIFDDAGLELPSLTAAFHTTPEPCKDHMGLHTRYAKTTVINICATHEREILRDGWRRRTLLHEMAHAWVDRHVPSATLERFMRHRDVGVWADPSIAWEDQGAEHAAETLMVGIQDEFPAHVRLDATSPEEMADAFAILTGQSS